MTYVPTMAAELDAAMVEAMDEVDREREDMIETRILVLWDFTKGEVA